MTAELEAMLGYTFKDKKLLERALSHRSQANESRHRSGEAQESGHNERLEFLGDAVLQLVVSDLLWEQFPEASEGRLSKMRSSLVSEPALAELAKAIDLGSHLLLGKGELATGGRSKPSILASGFEALIGAVYVEAGLDDVFTVIDRLMESSIKMVADTSFTRDFKSLLQEKIQETFRRAPVYRVHSETGPDHEKIFEVIVVAGDFEALGSGRNKKEAEQAAARALYDRVLISSNNGGQDAVSS